MDALIRALGVAGAAAALAKLAPSNTSRIDAVLNATKADSDAAFATVDRLAASLAIPRWFVSKYVSKYVSFKDSCVYVAVDFGEKSGARQFSDAETAMRLTARFMELESVDDATLMTPDGFVDKEAMKRHKAEYREWKRAVAEAAPTFYSRDLDL